MLPIGAMGIKANDMACARLVLKNLEHIFALPADTDAWGLAACVDQRVLFTKGPLIGSLPSISQVAEKSVGDCALWQFRKREDLRPVKLSSPNTNLGPFRFKAHAATIIGGPQNADEANENREFLLHSMPNFLSRALEGYSEGEALFFAIVAEMGNAGLLEPSMVDLRSAARAISRVFKALPVKAPRMVELSNGIDILHVSQGLNSVLVSVQGAEELANHNTVSDLKCLQAKLRRFHGHLSFSDVALGRRKQISAPEWAHLKIMPKNSCYLLGSNEIVEEINSEC